MHMFREEKHLFADMFTCFQVKVDSSQEHVFKGIEFVMEQVFTFTYDYGQVCYDKYDRDDRWPGLTPADEQCLSAVASANERELTLPVTLTSAMHSSDRCLNLRVPLGSRIVMQCCKVFNVLLADSNKCILKESVGVTPGRE